MSEVVRARLTGRAARWLEMVRDYGHLDQPTIEHIVLALADGPPGREHVIDLPAVRRTAAAVLYARDPAFGIHTGPLGEDWPLLFH